MDGMYDVPEELQDIMAESEAMGALRDSLIKRPFGFKKAKQCAIEQQRLMAQFWREIHVLYPETRGKTLTWGGDYVSVEQQASHEHEGLKELLRYFCELPSSGARNQAEHCDKLKKAKQALAETKK